MLPNERLEDVLSKPRKYQEIGEERDQEKDQEVEKKMASFLRAHNLEHSMSRRGNCHDNAVVESFFNLLIQERVQRRTYIPCNPVL